MASQNGKNCPEFRRLLSLSRRSLGEGGLVTPFFGDFYPNGF
jgi:hypothetical protein